MSEPMPISLVLAANDYKVTCMLAFNGTCDRQADALVCWGHADGTEHCDAQMREGLPFCMIHVNVCKAATGPLAVFAGVQPPPPCPTCGKPTTLHKVLTLRGVPM